jgi:hypothetical protein
VSVKIGKLSEESYRELARLIRETHARAEAKRERLAAERERRAGADEPGEASQ